MLKLILDTNLFRNSKLETLEDYKFSSYFERIFKLIEQQKIQDVKLVINEMALLEYIEQIGNWYQNEIVDKYEMIFNAIKNSYPAQRMYFQTKDDFIEDYKIGMYESLKSRNINIVQTIPSSQSGGVSIISVIEKTIKDIAPFDKKHNKDLKDAFISETINTEAKKNRVDTYIFITENDFRDNELLVENYKIEFVKQRNTLIQIFDTIKKYGSKIDDDVYYREFLKNDRFSADIKNFIEQTILNSEYYEFVPYAKKYDEKTYYMDYVLNENNRFCVKFYLLDECKKEYECGIIYDLSNRKPKILDKYITILEGFEEVVINELL
ncbi:MAG: DUF4935 domain-containing protein [Clostridia bacterium]|nr:DUF4935 domain-containing protein [Clostridia bacterium]